MVRWARVQYRVIQFFSTLSASLRPVDDSYAAQHLSPALFQLFQAMSRAEQHHSLDLCHKLEAEGLDDEDVIVAALLHDVGKIMHPPRLWERVLVVLVEYYAPRFADRVSQGAPRGWQRGFVTRRRHADWGAAMAAEAGATARAVDLIRRHHMPAGDDAALCALQALDDTIGGT